MVRLRNALLAVTLAAGLVGCANIHVGDYAHWSLFHCSECDDFPTPAYGPNGSMMPGSYTGPPAQSRALVHADGDPAVFQRASTQ